MELEWPMYDLIVIGDDLASHVAAAAACQNGINTLLIAENGLGGLKLIGDYVFNLDPTPITGLGPDGYGRTILKELGIEMPEDESAPLNPSYQIILPEHRLDFFNSLDALSAELAREFPDCDADIHDFYEMAQNASSVFSTWLFDHPHIQPRTLKEYIEYLKIYPYVFRYKFGVAKFDKFLSINPELEKVWEAQYALLAGNQTDMFSFASAFQYCAPLRGVSCFAQGKQFLFNELINKIESRNGLHLDHYQILSVTPGHNIDIEMKAIDGQISKVSSRNLIISTKSDKLSLLFDQTKPANYSDRFRPAKVIYYPFTLFLGVSQKCLPQQLARHVAVVCDINKGLLNDNLILLEAGPPEKDQRIMDARTPLTATVFLSPDKMNWEPDALKKKAADVISRLEYFLPFMADNIELNNVDQSIEISIACRNLVTPRYEVKNNLFTSFSAKSNKTRYRNIFLTGASLLSDAGFDAEIISGKNAAQQVLNKRKALHET